MLVEFNQKFTEVQHAFGVDEAEVYKKGNQLIIQLKGIHFSSGKAIIMPEDFQLLGKVQEAIEAFEDPSVVVEGHTDSIGDNESNQALSQQRAKAVHDYFLANKTNSMIRRSDVFMAGRGVIRKASLITLKDIYIDPYLKICSELLGDGPCGWELAILAGALKKTLPGVEYNALKKKTIQFGGFR